MQRGLKGQSGAALIVVLVLLTASLMLGLSSLQLSLIDERLSGNYKAAAEAQMRAEIAAAEAVGRNLNWNDVKEIFLDFESAKRAEWSGFEGGGMKETAGGGDICYESSCFYLPVKIGGENWVMALGAVFNDSKTLIAQSDPVYVKIKSLDFRPLSPLTVAQEFENFDPPDSQADFSGGGLVPPVTVATEGDKDLVIEKAGKKNLDGNHNEESGDLVEVSSFHPNDILDNPEDASLFNEFIQELERVARDSYTYYAEGVSENNYTFGDESNPKVSFVDGDVVGNNPSGAGVLVVSGSFMSNGNPSFNGLVIVLGDYVPGNGGGGNNLKGALLVAPYEKKDSESGSYRFVSPSVVFGGGGNNNFIYNRGSLDAAFGIIGDKAQDLWGGRSKGSEDSTRLAAWR